MRPLGGDCTRNRVYPCKMDYIWTPWRYHYIKSAHNEEGCVLCKLAESQDDEKDLVVYRGRSNFIVLNRYPYTSGHVMIVPFEHAACLEEVDREVAEEMIHLTQSLETAIRKLYRPQGLNIGMNIGKAAGAGVAGHIHMHVLPRWVADSNFMTVVGETRMLPEDLSETWRRLRSELKAQGSQPSETDNPPNC